MIDLIDRNKLMRQIAEYGREIPKDQVIGVITRQESVGCDGDLIRREEATSIPILPKEHRKVFNGEDDAFETGWNEALACVNMLPSADRPKGECPDCIDRQELIGSIQYLFDGLADSWVEASEKIIEIIREEPTVPQKEYTEQQIRDTFNSGYSCGMQNEWITDEPPVDGQEVIATAYWPEYGDSTIAVGHIDRFDKWHLYSPTEGELIKGFEVIAWMPLPEPYKGGEDE